MRILTKENRGRGREREIGIHETRCEKDRIQKAFSSCLLFLSRKWKNGRESITGVGRWKIGRSVGGGATWKPFFCPIFLTPFLSSFLSYRCMWALRQPLLTMNDLILRVALSPVQSEYKIWSPDWSTGGGGSREKFPLFLNLWRH